MPVRIDVPSHTPQQFLRRGSRRSFVLAAIAIVAVAGATLWPMNPFPRNGVDWIGASNGLKFEKRGVVLGTAPLIFSAGAFDGFTIELFVRPANTSSSRTMLGFYSGDRSKQLLIRQFHDGLLVTHDARIERDPTRTRKFDVDHVFRKGQPVCLAITSGPNGTKVYLDGQSSKAFPTFKISQRDLSGTIVLGTAPITYDPWQGELLGLALYQKELTPEVATHHCKTWTGPDGSSDLGAAVARYTFTERRGSAVRNEVSTGPALQIPDHFSLPYKRFLVPVWAEFEPRARYVGDLVINVLGFVPLGIIIFAHVSWSRTPKQSVLMTVVFCAVFSCTIEILQYYIPRRGSGWTDVITNTLGGSLGAILGYWNSGRAVLKRMKLIP